MYHLIAFTTSSKVFGAGEHGTVLQYLPAKARKSEGVTDLFHLRFYSTVESGEKVGRVIKERAAPVFVNLVVASGTNWAPLCHIGAVHAFYFASVAFWKFRM